MKRGKRYDTSDIMFAIITEAKKKCKHCGHTMLLGNSEKKRYVIIEDIMFTKTIK